jgi:hypothetical protein
MNIAIMYELSLPALNDTVLNELSSLGYMSSWTNSINGTKYNLPKFMVWKMNTTLQQGVMDIRGVVNRLNLTNPGLSLTKCITLNAFPWDGITG